MCLCLHAQPNHNLVNLQPVSFRVFPRRAPNPPAMCANAAWQCHGPLHPRRRPYIRVSIPRTPRLRTPRPRMHRSPHSQLPTALRPHHLLREVLPRRAHSGRAAAAHNRAVGSTPAPLATRPHEQATNRAGGGLAPQGRIRRDGSGQLNTGLQRQIKGALLVCGGCCLLRLLVPPVASQVHQLFF